MIEIKKMYGEDSFDICGYYSDGHVDKEAFVDIVIEHLKEDIEEGTIYLVNEDEEELLISSVNINKVEYIWYREEEIDDDCHTTTFWFSSKARKGYKEMTRYYL